MRRAEICKWKLDDNVTYFIINYWGNFMVSKMRSTINALVIEYQLIKILELY